MIKIRLYSLRCCNRFIRSGFNLICHLENKNHQVVASTFHLTLFTTMCSYVDIDTASFHQCLSTRSIFMFYEAYSSAMQRFEKR